jgi:hypothetical protein
VLFLFPETVNLRTRGQVFGGDLPGSSHLFPVHKEACFVSINWETILVALIHALATVCTTWMKRQEEQAPNVDQPDRKKKRKHRCACD